MSTLTVSDAPTVASRFAALVELSGLSFAQLDALAGKSTPGHAAMIASGARKSPRPESLEGYVRVLGTTVAHLLLGAGRAPGKRAVRASVKAAIEQAGQGGG